MARIQVRARAVDMLGRQQIAGIPTALHELIKNGHDAYARRVDIDYFRAEDLLVFRDDGLGMTREDFESRWLTLGTESKVGANRPGGQPWTGPYGDPPRPIMGEKGIGRLAIAAVGPQVLVLTRAVRQDGTHPLVVSLLHWGLFEIPGIDLASIEIPIEEIPSGLPSRQVVRRLADALRSNMDSLGAALDRPTRRRFERELEMLDIDVASAEARLRGAGPEGGPLLGENGHGTHFYIRPASPLLAYDIDGRGDEEASPLQKMLLGFGNTMMPDTTAPPLRAEFRDHREDGTVDELIGEQAFLTPDEFRLADHHVDGAFDEFGAFSGTVRIYGGEPRRYTLAWPDATGRPTECGPVRVRFAYLQGSLKDSRVPAEEWARLSRKLNKIGGLYIYRDGIRVLPYGNSDYDFLRIEYRRGKSANDWIFAYRRLFGAIELSHADNANLVEKAGREGFRANRAYREMVAMLEHFFQRLAKDFFRESGDLARDFQEGRATLQREAELLARRDEAVKVRRRALQERLDGFFEMIRKGGLSGRADEIRDTLASKLKEIAEVQDPERAAVLLLRAEGDARSALEQMTRGLAIPAPRGFGLTKGLRADLAAQAKSAARLEQDIIAPLRTSLDTMISVSSAKLGGGVGLRRRRATLARVQTRQDAGQQELQVAKRAARTASASLAETVATVIRERGAGLLTTFEGVMAEIGRTDFEVLDEAEVQRRIGTWEDSVDTVARDSVSFLEALRDQAGTLAEALSDGRTLDMTTAALESRAEEYREQMEAYADFAQVGSALGILQHEFAHAVKQIRKAIRSLGPWAEQTPGLQRVHDDLRSGFDHLDAYLTLFAPLSRQLHRAKVEMSGEEIERYLLTIFEERLGRHGVTLEVTAAFRARVVHGYLSTFLPCFVNLVDNSLYWIAASAPDARRIDLDGDSSGFTVTDTGPGVDPRIEDRIFEFGETTKPGGRGMGLFLSRQALRHEGHDLVLDSVGHSGPARFKVVINQSAAGEGVTGA